MSWAKFNQSQQRVTPTSHHTICKLHDRFVARWFRSRSRRPLYNLVTRSMNNFGCLPSPATLALRWTGARINLGVQSTYNYLFAHYGRSGGGVAEVWYVGNLSGIISIPAPGLVIVSLAGRYLQLLVALSLMEGQRRRCSAWQWERLGLCALFLMG